MLNKAPNQEQTDLFKDKLKQFLDLQHPLIKLAHSIHCKQIALELAPLYAHLGRPRRQPCAPSDLVHFSNRLAKAGMEKLLKRTIHLHQDKIKAAKTILVDTTVQEKNVTYPTDAGLYKKISM